MRFERLLFRRTLHDARRFGGILRRLRPHLAPQLPRLALAGLTGIAYSLVTLAEPWPMQVIFDNVLYGKHKVKGIHLDALAWFHGDRAALLAAAVVAMLVLAALRGQLYATQSVLAATAGQELVMRLRRELFRHLQTLSLAWHRRARSGDVMMRLTGDIAMLREMVVAVLVTVFSNALVVVGVLVIMAAINLRLTAVAIAILPALFVILSVFRVRLAEAASEQRKREGQLAAAAQEVVQSMAVVQAYTAEEYENARFRAANKRSLRTGIKATRIEAALYRNVQIAVAAGLAATLLLGVRDVMRGLLTPGQLLVFLAYVRGLYGPLRQISKTTQRSTRAAACGDRVLEVLDQVPAIADPADALPLAPGAGRIEFRGVTFAYEDGAPVLRDLDLEVTARETVALVGPTGSGKTTLVNLVPRFFDPQAGEVRVDGLPVHALRLADLRGAVGYLTQEPVVMGVSVRDNIAYGALGRPGDPPDESTIERAARAARAHEFIVRLPRGYDSVVGERGSTLSGGQRQRLALARLMLRDARILLLDEPTTGLDAVSERAILETLREAGRGRTTLIVAHHLRTVRHANRIVFLDAGRIVEQGSHDELVERRGAYAEYLSTQLGRRAWGGGPLAVIGGSK